MPVEKINADLLNEIARHYRRLGLKYRIYGLPYERCAELTYLVELVAPYFSKALTYLDIGSGGDSPLPTFLLQRSQWDISCIDPAPWVLRQRDHARRLVPSVDHLSRFHVIQQDFLSCEFAPETFDIITNISVIEHFEGSGDSEAMAASARLLKSGGLYLLTTLVNDGYFREYCLEREVYGKQFTGQPVFYQRHYDLQNLQQRLIEPSGLQEVSRIYFGDYGFPAFERLFQQRSKWLRVFYQWACHHFARRFVSYRPDPISRPDMMMNTASGVILVLTKPPHHSDTTSPERLHRRSDIVLPGQATCQH